MYRQVLFYARDTFLKMSRKSDTESPFTTVYCLGVKGLTASSYIMYDYTTSGHMDLSNIYIYVYIHTYIQYTYISKHYLFVMQ